MWFIPIIGPLLQLVVSVFTKQQDTALAKLKTITDADVEDAKTAANIIDATKDDAGIRLARDIVIFPVAIWTAIIGWDNIIVSVKPEWVWTVVKYPDSVAYLPYAVLAFLLGNIGINAWKRK